LIGKALTFKKKGIAIIASESKRRLATPVPGIFFTGVVSCCGVIEAFPVKPKAEL
jgi:hypothetical protein